jgi:hypothetical protein
MGILEMRYSKDMALAIVVHLYNRLIPQNLLKCRRKIPQTIETSQE